MKGNVMKKEPVKEKKPLWGKKQKVNAGGTDATICIAPRECDSVAIIRKAQEEIKAIKDLRVHDIVQEFFVKPFETDNGYRFTVHIIYPNLSTSFRI
jgi:hypothetical protein